MKIKLTESQYNRLLVENDKDFLDGQVELPHIGNKIDKFIIKLFNYIYKKLGPDMSSSAKQNELMAILRRDFSLSLAEATLLKHNYITIINEIEDGEDFSEYIGQPLEFYGEFKFTTMIPMTTYISGTMDGYVTGHATSVDDFIEQLKDNNWEDIDSDWNDYIESYPEDAEWDIDTDYAGDRITDEIIDLRRQGDEDDIRDRIEIM